jgi:hypothetical protein
MTSSESAAGLRRGPRRWYLAAGLPLVLGALVLAATACAGGSDDAAGDPDLRPAARRRGPVTTGFETGLPAGTSSGQAGVTAAAAHSGTRGLEVRARGGEAYLRWDTDALGEGPYWSMRAWVRVVGWTDGESVDLFTVRNGEQRNNFDLFVAEPGRRFMWDVYRENFGESGAPVIPGQWYLVEARGSFAGRTSSAEVRIGGVDQPPVSSPGQAPSVARELVLGSMGTDKTNTVQFDDVAIAVSDAPLPFLGAPATAGPAATQVVQP